MKAKKLLKKNLENKAAPSVRYKVRLLNKHILFSLLGVGPSITSDRRERSITLAHSPRMVSSAAN